MAVSTLAEYESELVGMDAESLVGDVAVAGVLAAVTECVEVLLRQLPLAELVGVSHPPMEVHVQFLAHAMAVYTAAVTCVADLANLTMGIHFVQSLLRGVVCLLHRVAEEGYTVRDLSGDGGGGGGEWKPAWAQFLVALVAFLSAARRQFPDPGYSPSYDIPTPVFGASDGGDDAGPVTYGPVATALLSLYSVYILEPSQRDGWKPHLCGEARSVTSDMREAMAEAAVAAIRLDLTLAYVSWFAQVDRGGLQYYLASVGLDGSSSGAPMSLEAVRPPLVAFVHSLLDPVNLTAFVRAIGALGFVEAATFDGPWALLFEILAPTEASIDEEADLQALALKGLTALLLHARRCVAGAPRSPYAFVPRRANLSYLETSRGRRLATCSAVLDAALGVYDLAGTRGSSGGGYGGTVAGDDAMRDSGGLLAPTTSERGGAFAAASVGVDATTFHVNIERAFAPPDYDSGQISIDVLVRQMNADVGGGGAAANDWLDLAAKTKALLTSLNRLPNPRLDIAFRKEAIKAVALASDMFTTGEAFRWMLTAFEKMFDLCWPHDTVALPFVIEGLAKAACVLNAGHPLLTRVVREALESKVRELGSCTCVCMCRVRACVCVMVGDRMEGL